MFHVASPTTASEVEWLRARFPLAADRACPERSGTGRLMLTIENAKLAPRLGQRRRRTGPVGFEVLVHPSRRCELGLGQRPHRLEHVHDAALVMR